MGFKMIKGTRYRKMDRDSIAVISQEASYERNSRQKNVGLIVIPKLVALILIIRLRIFKL